MKNLTRVSNKSGRSLDSKGERLGWASIKNARSENLDLLLSEGKFLKVNSKREPLLVP